MVGGYKVSDALELEFQVFVGHLLCMLGTELGSSEKELQGPNPLRYLICLFFKTKFLCPGCPGTL